MFARRVRTGPADAGPAAGSQLSECLLVEGSGNAVDDGVVAADTLLLGERTTRDIELEGLSQRSRKMQASSRAVGGRELPTR